MVSFSFVANEYDTEKNAPEKSYKTIAIAIQKINGKRRELAFKKRLHDALDCELTEEMVDRCAKSIRSELSTSRLSLETMSISKKFKKRVYCLYNLKHASFFCYEKEYVGNRNWIPCGWAEQEKQHVIRVGLERAASHFVKKLETEIDSLSSQIEVEEGALLMAMQAAIDGTLDDTQAAEKFESANFPMQAGQG